MAVMALAPLHEAFGIRKVFVATMQAVSGAGYPGVPSLDILGNVVPFIRDEEPKLERELNKILGGFEHGAFVDAPFAVSAHTNRVAVIDGRASRPAVDTKAYEEVIAENAALRAQLQATVTASAPVRRRRTPVRA